MRANFGLKQAAQTREEPRLGDVDVEKDVGERLDAVGVRRDELRDDARIVIKLEDLVVSAEQQHRGLRTSSSVAYFVLESTITSWILSARLRSPIVRFSMPVRCQHRAFERVAHSPRYSKPSGLTGHQSSIFSPRTRSPTRTDADPSSVGRADL